MTIRRGSRAYTVKYKLYGSDKVKQAIIYARTKEEAYDKGVYEIIMTLEHQLVYSAWVSAVTYNNGKYQVFNTFEGKPI